MLTACHWTVSFSFRLPKDPSCSRYTCWPARAPETCSTVHLWHGTPGMWRPFCCQSISLSSAPNHVCVSPSAWAIFFANFLCPQRSIRCWQHALETYTLCTVLEKWCTSIRLCFCLQGFRYRGIQRLTCCSCSSFLHIQVQGRGYTLCFCPLVFANWECPLRDNWDVGGWAW